MADVTISWSDTATKTSSLLYYIIPRFCTWYFSEFAGMVEELWQHALSFLDKYGVGVGEHWDELYEFADKTGILERHKQLLARPGHTSEVSNDSPLHNM